MNKNPGGDGAEPLFEWIHNLAGLRAGQRSLDPARVVGTPLATHLKYRFVK
ncbi:hypothetical protein [Streptomyces sp. NPDC050535]|uniref:hypothetical protein n=1 Tax=Streptomyces sp. NPDC050535 TaxID=3365626 RepID=UPI0037AE03F4